MIVSSGTKLLNPHLECVDVHPTNGVDSVPPLDVGMSYCLQSYQNFRFVSSSLMNNQSTSSGKTSNIITVTSVESAEANSQA